MNDLGVARRNLRQYRGRIASLGLIVVLGGISSLVCIGVVERAADSVQTTINEGPALRTVEVQDDPGRPDLKALRGDSVEALRSEPHVVAVEPWLQASFGIKTPEVGGVVLYATPARASALPPIVESVRSDVFPLRDGELVLPATAQGDDLALLLGQEVPVRYTQKIGEGEGEPAIEHMTVVAIYDASYALDGPSVAYTTLDQTIRWAAAREGVPAEDFVEAVGYRKLYVVVDESTNVADVTARLRDEGYNAVSLRERLSSLPAGLNALHTLGVVVLVLMLLYAAIAGLGLSASFMRSRTREIGVLNAVGYRPARIFRVLLVESLMVGGAAGAAAAALGAGVSAVLGEILGGRQVLGVVMPDGLAWPGVGWIVLVLLAPALTVTVGGLVPAWRVANLPADTAMRDAS